MAMQPALIALDIDGTLLPPDSRDLSAASRKAIETARAAGIEVAIATGRRHHYAAPILERAELPPETILISSNGSVMRTLAGERLRSTTLPPELACELSAALEPWSASVVFTLDREGAGELLVASLAALTEQVPRWVAANQKSIQEVCPLSDAFREPGAPGPIQGMICGTAAGMLEAEQRLRESEFAGRLEVVRTSYTDRDLAILDLLPLGCSKGAALAALAASRGLTSAQVMAVGDNWNDESMLNWAGWPVLMGNAEPELLAIAPTRNWQIAPSNDQEGVAFAIEAAVHTQGSLEALKAVRREASPKLNLETGR